MSVVRAFCNPRYKDIKISKSLAFAYVDSDRMGAENLEVGLLGQNHKVRGLSKPVHDPENALLKR
jgi:hypothetical protein